MKLSKDSKSKFTIKSIVASGVVILLVVVTAYSFSNKGRVQFLEETPFSSVFYGFGKHLNNVVTTTGGFIDDLINFRSNSTKLKELNAENEKLRQELIEQSDNENKLESLEMLKKSLNYVDSNKRNQLVSASIIGKNEGDWYKTFVIDAGADSGVVKDSIVINGDGVVGIVFSVSNKYSKAISIIDSRASVSFKISGKETSKGVITTSSDVGSSDFSDVDKLLQGYFFDTKAAAEKNDLIVTSGLGLYPENIPIGKISKVTYDKNKSMKYIKVRPSVDFKKLDIVSIIPPRKLD